MDQQTAQQTIWKAASLLISTKNLPLKIDAVELWPQDKFRIHLTDTKLQSTGHDTVSCFSVTFTNDVFENMSTTSTDLAARIPSNASKETRVILRIGYSILVEHLAHIIRAFEVSVGLARNNVAASYYSAKKWYDELRNE